MIVVLFEAPLSVMEQARTLPGVISFRNSLTRLPNGTDGQLRLYVSVDSLAQLQALGTVTALTSEDDYLATLQPATPSVATGPRDFSSLA